MSHPVVWVADVGSVRQYRFGWCRASLKLDDVDTMSGTDILAFAQGLAKDLSHGKKVAVGFECPLFVPIADDPARLTSARKGEGNRAWSAGAGATVLATGLTECVWILERIRQLASVSVEPTFSWEKFRSGEANLFIWEAFVSGKSKTASHLGDAESAARAFWDRYPDVVKANAVTAQHPYSLIGAALLRAGLTIDLSVLSEQCIVIRA